MNTHMTVDVLICGAGAAGLTLAIALARQGTSFRLIEKSAQPFHGSRGKGIQPRTQEIFEDLGILDRVVALGGVYPNERCYRDDGTYTDAQIMENAEPTPAEPYRSPLMVPQFMTERVMRERLHELGHAPEYGRELVGFEQIGDWVSARIAGNDVEETLQARWLVGADGGRSFVRRTLGLGFPGKTLGVRAVVADVMLGNLSRDHWHRYGSHDMQRQISLCPLAGTELFQLQAPIPFDTEVDLSARGLTHMVAERTGRNDIHIQSVSWASAYVMNARLADHYREGNVFIVGDAAHVHPPTGGQGLNTSVQDAYNLAWKLSAVSNGAPGGLLDTYEQERRPVAAVMLGLATTLLDNHKRGEMRRGREVQQLDIGYPDSTLAFENPPRSGALLAGDRAPDAPMRHAAGHSIRLFELLQGDHWTLLGYGAQPDRVQGLAGMRIHIIGTQGDLLDEHGHFKTAYELAVGDWVLIRPDGYIGAIVAASEVESLGAYFKRVGLAV